MTQIAFSEVKARVGAMQRERASVGSEANADPSAYWASDLRRFRYLTELTDESLRDIRLHTFHLTGDYHAPYRMIVDPDAWASARSYFERIEGLPADLLIAEPEDGFGVRLSNGRLVSSDIIRYQRVIHRLWAQGTLRDLRAKGQGRILEIGGGYGGMALHLSRALPGVQYFIVDIPETLFFSGCYLTLQAGSEAVYLYHQDDFAKELESGFAGRRFILLPNWRLDDLSDTRFDLAVNVESFQEMTTAQVAAYVDFIADHASILYSWNGPCNPANAELSDVHTLLARRFALQEPKAARTTIRERVQKIAGWAAARVGLVEARQPKRQVAREHFCMPR